MKNFFDLTYTLFCFVLALALFGLFTVGCVSIFELILSLFQ